MAVFISEDAKLTYFDTKYGGELQMEKICVLLSCSEESVLIDNNTVKTAIVIYSRDNKIKNEIASYMLGYDVFGEVIFATGRELPDNDTFIKRKTEANTLLDSGEFNEVFVNSYIADKSREYFRSKKEKITFDYDKILERTNSDNLLYFKLVMNVIYTVLSSQMVVSPNNTIIYEMDDIYVVLGDDAEEQIKKIIDYFISCEEYEKCDKLSKIKVEKCTDE